MLFKFYAIMPMVLSLAPIQTMAYGTEVCGMTYQANNGMACRYCPPGTFLVADCELLWGSPDCRPCPEDHYQPYCHVARTCAPCYPCQRHGGDVQIPCTKTQNTTCVCPPGKYYQRQSSSDGLCIAHQTCSVGYGVKTMGTPWNDAVCDVCESGTFSDSESSDECYICSTCQVYRSRCSKSNDATCNDDTKLSECGPLDKGFANAYATNYDGQSTYVDTLVTFSCDSDHILVGEQQTITCKHDDDNGGVQWIKSGGVCIESARKLPQDIINGLAIGTTVVVVVLVSSALVVFLYRKRKACFASRSSPNVVDNPTTVLTSESNGVVGQSYNGPSLSDDRDLLRDADPFNALSPLLSVSNQNGAVQHERPSDQNGTVQHERPSNQNGTVQHERPSDQNGTVQHERPSNQNGTVQHERPSDQNGTVQHERPSYQNGGMTTDQVSIFLAEIVSYKDLLLLLRKCPGVSEENIDIDIWIGDVDIEYNTQGCREKRYQLIKKYCQARPKQCYIDICQAMKKCGFNVYLDKFETWYKDGQSAATGNTDELTSNHAQDTKAVFVDIGNNADRQNNHGVQFVSENETLQYTLIEANH